MVVQVWLMATTWRSVLVRAARRTFLPMPHKYWFYFVLGDGYLCGRSH